MTERSKSNGFSKQWCSDKDPDVWFDLTNIEFVRCQPLIPTDWPLEFNLEFITEAATNPAIDTLGTYTMGWEL